MEKSNVSFKSDMLKSVFFRIDYSASRDFLDEFMRKLKNQDWMPSYFQRLRLIPKNKRKEEREEDFDLPYLQPQEEMIYHFEENPETDNGIAVLDVSSNYVCLFVDCRKGLKSSGPYIWIIAKLYELLMACDTYVSINRLGVRKIDIQVVKDEYEIDKFFNENFVVALGWGLYGEEGTSVLTNVIRRDGVFFNIIQRMDRIPRGLRLIFDIDSYITGDVLDRIGGYSKKIEYFLNEKVEKMMFHFFVDILSRSYIKKCMQADSEDER